MNDNLILLFLFIVLVFRKWWVNYFWRWKCPRRPKKVSSRAFSAAAWDRWTEKSFVCIPTNVLQQTSDTSVHTTKLWHLLTNHSHYLHLFCFDQILFVCYPFRNVDLLIKSEMVYSMREFSHFFFSYANANVPILFSIKEFVIPISIIGDYHHLTPNSYRSFPTTKLLTSPAPPLKLKSAKGCVLVTLHAQINAH